MSVALSAANLNDSADGTAPALSSMVGLSCRCRCYRMLHFKDDRSRLVAEAMHQPDCDPPKTFFGHIDRMFKIFFHGFR